MNEPKKPDDPPPPCPKPDPNPTGHTPHGVPHGAEHEESKGLPNSDRTDTETVVNKT